MANDFNVIVPDRLLEFSLHLLSVGKFSRFNDGDLNYLIFEYVTPLISAKVCTNTRQTVAETVHGS